MTPRAIQSLLNTGTKLWLDSVDPDLVKINRIWGATGATSNPVIVADLVKTGRFDVELERLIDEGLADETIAWRLTAPPSYRLRVRIRSRSASTTRCSAARNAARACSTSSVRNPRSSSFSRARWASTWAAAGFPSSEAFRERSTTI